MMKTYLTPEEVAELKEIRKNYFVEGQLTELKDFLKKNKKEISLDNQTNINNVWEVIYKTYESTILKYPDYVEFKNKCSYIQYGSEKQEKEFAITHYLETLNPELYRIYKLAQNLNFKPMQDYVNNKVSQMLDKSVKFDSGKFCLEPDFDYRQYSIEYFDKNLVENTLAINTAVTKFFDLFSKELNAEQKAIVSKNFLQTITYFLENSTPTIIKEKGNDFKRLLTYTHNL